MNKFRNFSNDLVSVIIPVYNAEKFIEDTVLSAIQQTYKHIEIILVDDQSSDNSSEIIRSIASSNKNIIYYLQPKNFGAGVARNKALEIAKGRYVAFLDADDIWSEDKIEKQICLMKRSTSPFCYTAIEMIDKNNNVIKSKRNVVETINYNFLLRNTMIATSSVVVDRMVLGDFMMHLRRGGQDYATWLKLLRNDVVAVGINEALVKYRISSNSLSSNKFKSIRQVWEIQVNEEKIPPVDACINTFYFCGSSCTSVDKISK